MCSATVSVALSRTPPPPPPPPRPPPVAHRRDASCERSCAAVKRFSTASCERALRSKQALLSTPANNSALCGPPTVAAASGAPDSPPAPNRLETASPRSRSACCAPRLVNHGSAGSACGRRLPAAASVGPNARKSRPPAHRASPALSASPQHGYRRRTTPTLRLLEN
ncbi:protein YABBY 3-like [Schistocerca americana]|uniref:protein YABBY 3-like n=1 Tax=Schistocerca americana TaxID=7009 RepID=UPI001F4F26C1|nr:protein YABBY 3-like [Schistocerca americana]